jgi:hypothetical protein
LAQVEPVKLGQGDMAVVVLGGTFDLPESYENHPQVISLNAKELPYEPDQISSKIPNTTKIILMTDGVPAQAYQSMNKVFRQRGLPFLVRKNTHAMEMALDELFPKKPKKLIAPKGTVSDLVKENVDLTKSNAEEARRLMTLAKQRNLQTTVGSLSQAIAVYRRKSGGTAIPKSIMSAKQQALAILDEAINNLTMIREYVIVTEAENEELKEIKRKAEDLFKPKHP